MNNADTAPVIEDDYEYYEEDEEYVEPTESEKEEWRQAYWEIIKKENAASLKVLGVHENSKPAPVAITSDNYADKSLSRQKWGFEIIARKKHRAFLWFQSRL